jgi:8-oxo-dGTP diphosphatase
MWEFPGGKVEPGETAWTALVRELKEELNISATHGKPFIQLTHDYSDRVITLDVWRVDLWDGEPDAQESQTTGWYSISEMGAMPLLPADAPVLDALR